jgi:hypothetical protein
MHKDIYQSNAGGSPTPQGLQQSVIADAVLHASATADIPPYTPVRLIRNMTITNPGINTPSYEVLPVANIADNDFMPSYGFTLGEGLSAANGGRVVVSGVAYASVTKADLTHSSKLGTWDSTYYVVNDGSLMTTANHSYLSPVGHFRLLAWNDLTQVNSELAADTDEVLLMIDLDTSPESFVVTTDTICNEVTDTSGTFTMVAVEGNVRYIESSGVTASLITLTEPSVEAEKYKVLVYNMVGRDREAGSHQAEYSKVYGCFVFSGPQPPVQTVKIGKTDADIIVGSSGSISIWSGGVDTGDNQTAHLDWMAGTTDVSSGKEVLITYFADEDLWRITGAECEDAV